MKIPLFFSVLIVLSLITPLPTTKTAAAPDQSEPEYTLVSSEEELLALISDYSLTSNQFCFKVTNLSESRTILGVGPNFGQRVITASGLVQSGPGSFFLSQDRILAGFYGEFSVEVGFALLAPHPAGSDPDLDDGIRPRQSTSFCVSGDFKGLKAKNIAKNLLVLATDELEVPPQGTCFLPVFSCGGVNAQFTISPTCDQLCVSITNNSQINISSVNLEFLSGASFSGGFIGGIASGQTSESCGSYASLGPVVYRITVVFADGTSCSDEIACCDGGAPLTVILGGRQ